MKKFRKLYVGAIALLYSIAVSAQQVGGGGAGAQFKNALGSIAGIIISIAFVLGLGLLTLAGYEYKAHKEYHVSLIAGLLLAGAPVVITVLYLIFGLGAFAATPNANW